MYNKTTWLARLGTGLNKWRDQITNQLLELISEPDSVSQAGTPFSIAAMNNIEDQIESLSNELSEDIPIVSSTTSVPLTAVLGQTKPTIKGLSVPQSNENGDFTDGTTGYSIVTGTGALNVVDGNLEITCTATFVIVQKTLSPNFTIDDLWNLSSEISHDSIGGVDIGLAIDGSTGGTLDYAVQVTNTIAVGEKALYNGDARIEPDFTGDLVIKYVIPSIIIGDIVTIHKETGLMAINKTSLDLEDRTVAQMEDIAKGGYFEDIKDFDEVIESITKNAFDINAYMTGSLENKYYSLEGEDLLVDALDDRSLTAQYSPIKLGSNKECTISVENETTGFRIIAVDENGIGLNVQIHTNTSLSATFDTGIYEYIGIKFVETSGFPKNLGRVQIEYDTEVTEKVKYQISTQRISGASVPVIADTECLKNVEKYQLKSINVLSLGIGDVNIDRVEIQVVGYKAPSVNILYDGSFLIQGFVGKDYADSIDNEYTTYSNANGNMWLCVPNGTYASLAEAQSDLTGTKTRYQLESPEQRTDSEVLTVYEKGTILVPYTPNELILVEVSNNEAQTRKGNAEAIGRLTNRMQSVRNDYIMESSKWVDDTSNADRPFWYYEIYIDCTSDDHPFFAVDPTQKFNGLAATLTNDIESFNATVRIYANSQPSDNLTITVGVR